MPDLKSTSFGVSQVWRQIIYAISCVVLVAGCDDSAAKRAALDIEHAQSQVQRIAADLDKRTTDSGVYIRIKDGEIKETDSWGTMVEVSYSQGGVAEMVTVRSAGPDREFDTKDDIVGQGTSTNFKGIGEGIKKNAEETAANTAKGIVKGTVKGVKDSIKESLPFQKKKPGNVAPKS